MAEIQAAPASGAGTPEPVTVGATGAAGVSLDHSAADHSHPAPDVATVILDGFMSAADKATLDGLATSVPSSRNLIAGAGLTGGGDLSADRTFDITAGDSSMVINADDIRVGVISEVQHGDHPINDGLQHAAATASFNGYMTAAQFSKLAGIAASADVDGKDVRVSSDDTTPGFLVAKIVAGTNITLTPSGPGNETLTVTAAGGAAKFSPSFFLESPGPSENDPSVQFDVASTLSKLRIVCRGTTPSIDWELRKGSVRTSAGTLMASGTATSVTTGHEVTTFADATIAAGDHVWLVTTAQSGAVLSFRLTMFGTED